MNSRFVSLIACFLLSVSLCQSVAAEIKLANIFGDNMVLQRDQTLYFFGTATGSEEVTVTLKGKSKSTITMADGTWMSVSYTHLTLPTIYSV